MAAKQPRVGLGQFQWNTGGWFGAQIGSTIWLLLSALILIPKHVWAGTVALACFLAPNVLGTLLWLNRDRMTPYPALQGLIGMIGVFSFTAILYLDGSGLIHELDSRLSSERWGFYFVPALFAGLMVFFHIMERKARKRGERAA